MNSRKDLQQKFADLQRQSPRKYWRSLEELAGDETFQELMRCEFPEQADVWPDSLSRRSFLSLMGASLALAGLGGCSVRPAPVSKIVPYVRPPKEIVPGRPLFFATTMCYAGSAVGLLVESHMGRPTKIEGNPDHPASRGATSAIHQSAVLTLYDPDRSQTVTHLGRTRSWDDAFSVLRTTVRQQQEKGGAGLRILSEPILSPTLSRLRQQLLEKLPQARWHTYVAIDRDAAFEAAQMAFGQPVDVHYDFTKADVVLSLDADFLAGNPAGLHEIDDFMSRRRIRGGKDDAAAAIMNRLYVVETAVTSTGAKADHRLALRSSEIESFARQIAAEIQGFELPSERQSESSPSLNRWATAIARDLAAHRGRSAVIVGDGQPASVHLLAHALNQHLGNFGQTVLYTEPIAQPAESSRDSLRDLLNDIDRGGVEALIVLGGNPVYTAPVDLNVAERLQKIPLRIHLGLYQDETARQCHWHLPEAHFLEAWGDARAFDGTASLIQPLIEPLYHGRTAIEITGFLLGEQETAGDEFVRKTWRDHWDQQEKTSSTAQSSFSDFWQTCLHDGVIPNTALETKDIALVDGWQDRVKPTPHSFSASTLEIVFRPDPSLHDGSFANNGWLQELPKPITKLTWDNAVLMSPATAEKLGVGLGRYAHGGEHGGFHVPVVELQLRARTLLAPIWIMPGHAEGSVTVHLGYGRHAAGRVGGTDRTPVGFNAYLLRTLEHYWFAPDLRIVPTGREYALACTQQHQLMENREVVRAGTLEEYRGAPEQITARQHEEPLRADGPLTFYKPFDYSPPVHKWGMAIDLTTCVGCNACVIACQAENNIPVVGKKQVSFGREMHWLRIDRYFSGTADDPQEFHFQPLPCMHCEQAPCEYVCPVEATVHSAQGLNDMVYNRCVGTRFCSNNCPYKVRRFNFLQYADFDTPTLQLQYNPDVTVRSRGVMEKCSYCVQRIRQAEIDSQKEDRPIADGEVLTACQAACPAQAIVFGDINDPQSAVAKWKNSPLNYGLLSELNTVPRTTYLAAMRNPNPELSEVGSHV